jgi:hypothetical protein
MSIDPRYEMPIDQKLLDRINLKIEDLQKALADGDRETACHMAADISILLG